MGLLLIPIILFSQTINISEIVLAQSDIFYIIPFFPFFMLFLVTGLAETNRVPFDSPEAESELVSGYMLSILQLVLLSFF